MITFTRLKHGSFIHSAIYLALLAVWIIPGLKGPTFVLGLAHGIGWIVMSLTCLYAVRTKVVSLRLGVAVAVIGAIGPFVGSYEFVREEQKTSARPESASRLCP